MAKLDTSAALKWVGNYIAGVLRAFVVLAPIVLVISVLAIFGQLNKCTGECAGLGYLVIFAFYYGIPFVFVGILLYVVAFAISLTTWKGEPVQYIGALTIVPAVLFAAFSWHVYTSMAADARVDKRFLLRTNPNPVGTISHLLIESGGDECRQCAFYVLNGVAERVSSAWIDPEGRLQLKNSYRKASGDACAPREGTVYFQRTGQFDICIVNDGDRAIDSGAILFGMEHYLKPPITRPEGLTMAAVAFRVVDGGIGPEMLRWEYGRTKGSSTKHGKEFNEPDFIRALTGNQTDRRDEFDALSFNERLAIVTSWIGKVPMNPEDVIGFLKAPTTYQKMNEMEVRAAFEEICARSPAADFMRPFDAAQNSCARDYNYWTKQFGDRFTDAARLPEPSA